MKHKKEASHFANWGKSRGELVVGKGRFEQIKKDGQPIKKGDSRNTRPTKNKKQKAIGRRIVARERDVLN